MPLAEDIAAAHVRTDVDAAARRAEATFCFRADQAFFAGHFPGRPLVPGFMQIELALHTARSLGGQALDLAQVERAKFLTPLTPDCVVRVAAYLPTEDEGTCCATITCDGTDAARIVLALRSGKQPVADGSPG